MAIICIEDFFFSPRRCIRRRRCNFGSRIFLLARKVNRAPSFIWRVPHTWRPRPNVYLFCFREPIITFATGACNDLCPLTPYVFFFASTISRDFPFLSMSRSRPRFSPITLSTLSLRAFPYARSLAAIAVTSRHSSRT